MYGFQKSQSMLPMGTIACGLLSSPCLAMYEQNDPEPKRFDQLADDEYEFMGMWNTNTKDFVLANKNTGYCGSCGGTGQRKPKAEEACSNSRCKPTSDKRKRKCEHCRCPDCFTGRRFGSEGGQNGYDSSLYHPNELELNGGPRWSYAENKDMEKNFAIVRKYKRAFAPKAENLWVGQIIPMSLFTISLSNDHQTAKIISIEDENNIAVELMDGTTPASERTQLTVEVGQLQVKEQIVHQLCLRHLNPIFERHWRDYYPFSEKPTYVLRLWNAHTAYKYKGMGYGSAMLKYMIETVKKSLANGEKVILIVDSDCFEDHELAMKRVNWFSKFGFKVNKKEWDANNDFVFDPSRGGGLKENRMDIKEENGVWKWVLPNKRMAETIPDKILEEYKKTVRAAAVKAKVADGGCSTAKFFEERCPDFFPKGSRKYFGYPLGRGMAFVTMYLEITKNANSDEDLHSHYRHHTSGRQPRTFR